MRELRYTVLSDGSSDGNGLIPILDWVLRQHLPSVTIQSEWADLRRLRWPPGRTLSERLDMTVDLYPCDVLFLHRDAEGQGRERRLQEIQEGVAASSVARACPHVPVIPVRMMEAWLLIDESAIRKAAGNPNGRVALKIPKVRSLEDEPDPKDVLYALLRVASELTGRRLDKLNVRKCATKVADYIEDFSPLYNLEAFRALELDVKKFAAEFLKRG